MEASIVFPLVLFSVLFVWHLGCGQHNRCTAQSICREAVYAGTNAMRENLDGEAAARRVLEEQSAYFFGAEGIQTEAEVRGGKLTVSVTVRMRFPIKIGRGTGAEEGWMIQETAAGDGGSPVQKIRAFRRVKRLTGEGAADEGGL